MTTSKKHYRTLKKLVKHYGFFWLGQQQGGHIKVVDEDGRMVATCSTSASCRRAIKNFEADLRRAKRRRSVDK